MSPIKMMFRSVMMYKRNRMLSQDCIDLSTRIYNNLLDIDEWKQTGNINIYKSVGNEVSTEKIINEASKSNKIIYHPTKEPEDNIIEVDLVIVPGVVFDEKLARYGRGQGYYDRFLCRLPKKTIVIAVGYDFQVITRKWRLGLKSHDIKMDYIITEKRVIQKKGTFFY
jgi:5-formyltetrahydrofolate cyclo-ligase